MFLLFVFCFVILLYSLSSSRSANALRARFFCCGFCTGFCCCTSCCCTGCLCTAGTGCLCLCCCCIRGLGAGNDLNSCTTGTGRAACSATILSKRLIPGAFCAALRSSSRSMMSPHLPSSSIS